MVEFNVCTPNTKHSRLKHYHSDIWSMACWCHELYCAELLQKDPAIPAISTSDIMIGKPLANAPGCDCYLGVWREQALYPDVAVSLKLVPGTSDYSIEELEGLFSAIKLYRCVVQASKQASCVTVATAAEVSVS
jgi:hypothetical protein